MRRNTFRKSLAIVSVLGLIWIVAMIGGTAVLTHPMLALYETLSVESAAVQVAATASLVMSLSSIVTVGVWLALRSGGEPVTQRR